MASGGVEKGSLNIANAKALFGGGASGSKSKDKAPAKAAPSSSAASDASASSGGGGGQNALFAAINKGGADGNLTKGLNKVTKDQKTKYRSDKSGKVPSGPSKSLGAKKKASEKKEDDKPPQIKATPDRRITISYYKNFEKLLVFGSNENDPKESEGKEYKVFDTNDITNNSQLEFWDCQNSNFKIAKKCKTVKLYNCKRVGIEIEAVLATIEITNVNNANVFVREKAGSIMLEKCDGAKITLFANAASSDPAPQLYSTLSQNTELTILKGDDEDPQEVPVPSQFLTTIVDGQWKTAPVEHNG